MSKHLRVISQKPTKNSLFSILISNFNILIFAFIINLSTASDAESKIQLKCGDTDEVRPPDFTRFSTLSPMSPTRSPFDNFTRTYSTRYETFRLDLNTFSTRVYTKSSTNSTTSTATTSSTSTSTQKPVVSTRNNVVTSFYHYPFNLTTGSKSTPKLLKYTPKRPGKKLAFFF